MCTSGLAGYLGTALPTHCAHIHYYKMSSWSNERVLVRQATDKKTTKLIRYCYGCVTVDFTVFCLLILGR